jgi:phage repressor protein C with HTH and peptisase S24 domain
MSEMDVELGFGGVVQRRRTALRLSLAEVARRAGCAKSYLSAIENGVKGAPGEELAARLERVLSFRDGELVEMALWARTPAPVRADVEAMRARDAAGRELVKALMRDGIDAAHQSGKLAELIAALEGESVELDSGESQAGVERVELPMEIPLINKVTAGYPGSFTDLGYPARVADEYVRAPDVHDPDAFAARVVGDSMEPLYREGDIVVFSPAKVVESGMDCFVRLEPDHETTFKRVYFEEDAEGREVIRIQPMNSAYGPMVVERERVAGLYAGVSVTRSIR